MKLKIYVSWLNLNASKLNRNLFFLFVFFFSNLVFSQQKYTLPMVRKDLGTVEKSITITKNKMKEFGDISFLPDLYFVLADLYHEKSRLLYEEERIRFPKKNLDDLDLSASRKAKKMAIETYTRFTENYPKDEFVDKAFFNIAMSYRELGQIEDMVQVFIKITKDFPKSKFWEESQLRLGDYFFERKKEYDLALEIYQKILDRPANAYVPFAKYKMGFCYINQDKFDKALNIFESVLLVDVKDDENKGLSEELKMTDIRRDTLVALVWPYSEIEKHTEERKRASVYFESLAPDRVSLIQVLNRLGKRLLVKNRHIEAVPVFARLIEISYDLDIKLQATNNFYESYKKSKKPYNVDKIMRSITQTISQVRNSSSISLTDRKNAINNFEIYIRDFSTALNKQANDEKSKELKLLAAEIYEDYLTLYPRSSFYSDISTNLAEIYFGLENFNRAGYYYEQAYSRKKNPELLQSSIKAYGQSLLRSDKLSRLEVEESRSGYRDMGSTFVKLNPSSPITKEIEFNIAKIYYDERRFDVAVQRFQKYISAYPSHEKSKAAINLILDTYNQREDYKGLIAFGQNILSGRSPASIDVEFKTDIAEIVKQAQFRTLEDKVGDPRSRDYAKKLLAMGQKYKGSSLGDLAIYEAYSNFKNKKDPLVYSAGEQLLEKHADSKYAKEVVADLGQIAIKSGDYDRAAGYFEKFMAVYPKDPLSETLVKSAAILRENQGDYEQAFEHYKKMDAPFTKLADLLAKSKKWKQLNQLAMNQPADLVSNYYIGLSLVRVGERKSAVPYFDKVLKVAPQSDEQKTMAAHSLYLRASEALRDYKQIKFGRGDDAEVTQLKGQKLKVLNDVYDRVIAYGNGKWVIGALYELGQSYKEFSEFLAQAPIPKGLTPDVVAAYKQAIQTQSEEYRVKSGQYFKSCLSNAEKFEVFTLFVKGCRSSGDYIVDEAIDEVNVRKPAGKSSPDVKRIRQALLDKSDQPELVKELGVIYIRNLDYGMAKLAFNRYLEMRPESAEGLAYLGIVEMYSLDFERAKGFFKAAQRIDKDLALSQLGLAAMYKKFGFQQLFTQTKIPSNRRQYAQLHPWIDEVM
jgi:cellulose synthase operon protein C